MNKDTWLKTITIQNFRCFSELTVEFDLHLTVLVANNGLGKTTVLDAVGIALSAFIGAFHNGKRNGIAKKDVRLKVTSSDILQMEPQYPCVLNCTGTVVGQTVAWQRRRNTPNSNNTYKEANDLIAIGEALQQQISEESEPRVILPLMAFYGTGRLWSQKKYTGKKSFEAEFYSRTAGYLDCLDPLSNYKYFVDWFRFTSKAHRDLREQNEQRFGERGLSMPTPYADLLKSVGEAVDICLAHTRWGRLRFSSIHDNPIVEHPRHGMLEVSQLSDGLRNMIAMIADIAYRATRLNSHLKDRAACRTPGIVLIDEIDMHLHPEWQQNVLAQMRKAFPNIQFIVTTHSPQVLSSISRQHIRLLEENTDGQSVAAQPVAESYARTNADVLQSVMHVNPTPEFEEQALLEEYRTLVEQGDIHDERLTTLKQKLFERLGENHPDMVRLDMVKHRREILGDILG